MEAFAKIKFICKTKLEGFLLTGLVIFLSHTFVPQLVCGEVAPKMSPSAKPVPFDPKVFRNDPVYKNKKYDSKKQIDIYGSKTRMKEVRPLLELGRPIYTEGIYEKSSDILGRKNPVAPAFSIFGDLRSAIGFNDKGADDNGLAATRLNLNLDLKLTGTERIHTVITPLNQGGNFTQFEFAGDDPQNGNLSTDLNIDTMFFEGDLGAISAGLTDKYNPYDIPFSFGLMPLLFQNGVWFDDAFIGAAFAIPSISSPKFTISNMDFTFFGGVDKVTTPAIKDETGSAADHSVSIYGATTYIEANEGYWEAGIGRIDGEDGFDEFSYNSATIAFTKRYGRRLSNSLRTIYTFGQDRENSSQQTADGWIFLFENSLITSKPSTFIPYGNFWVGFDRPQPLADDTGILKNTGINYETNGLTGFPNLDDTGHDTWGGAIGLEYLFNLDQQFVVEFASTQILGEANEIGRASKDDQYALGFRYQLPISKSWILRSDAMYGSRKNDDDIAGFSIEMRYKF